MFVTVKLHSNVKGEINSFLSKFYNTDLNIYDDLYWKKDYKNPIELSDIIGAFIDNREKFNNLYMWICIDKNVFIHINDSNANNIIRYLFERFPY